jgi:predicted SprT family Zn-dependent metalloprotease
VRLSDAARLARELMDRHGLTDWSLVFDNARARAGVCRSTQKVIGLSRPLTQLHADDEVRDTILHEIAHALVGPEHAHDEVWRAEARRIGCTAERCVTSVNGKLQGDWVGTCPAGHVSVRYRRPQRVQSCGKCSSRFDPDLLIDWTFRGARVPMDPRYVREATELRARRSAGVTAAAGTTGTTTGTAGGGADGGAGSTDGACAGAAAGRSTRPALALGATVRLTGTGRYTGLIGPIVKIGRTRYHVQTSAGTITAPASLVELL